MLRRLVVGLGLLSATMLSQTVFAADGRTLQIIVSKDKQQMVVYDGEAVVATTRISSGKAGHTTPSGIFSILEKEKYHESNIYSNAPMPWMQRITWSGIALHEGVVPNHPASHGCVRMPGAFARSLYDMTANGAHVIITDAPVTPQLIDDVVLFKPRKSAPTGPLLPDVELRTSSIKADPKPVQVAMNVAPENPLGSPIGKTSSDAPAAQPGTPAATKADGGKILRILITRRGDRETLMDAQVLLESMGFETGGSDGYLGPLTRSAITGFKRWKNLSQKGPLISGEFLDALYAAADKPKPPAGQIMVRQNFEPMFEAPVGIKAPEVALGTHLFTVTDVNRQEETAEWHAVTLPNQLSDATMKRLGITLPSDSSLSGAARAALDRIEIPDDIREKIETAMADGTSITINDQGLGPDTGKGTDFITITQPEQQVAEADTSYDEPVEQPRPAKRSSNKQYRSIGLY
ncbi:L,D-transpeptidase [Neorhizobium alkalisoli]|uniref:L,D-transpeptidase-like protein n=1 Tax=Neorhizobium alkalisoli TaxID=528178 RepID=A0A561R1X4_9HYPH|nr:L,D-transpeptidase family protein [Neorhizobium alkalisoli]TWF56621.1 L,D-transpeptidase-like protein [Neorhizobium alkalisoli]